MIGQRKNNLGDFEYLRNRDVRKLFKHLLSVEFNNMPFFKYATALAALLKEEFFVNALIVGQATKDTDITWFIKDYSTHLDFVSDDFSQFTKDSDLYQEVNFVQTDFLKFKPQIKYDLVIVIEDLDKVNENLQDYIIKIGEITETDAKIVLFLRYDLQATEKSEQIIYFKSTEQIKDCLPFAIENQMEIKNYEKGHLAKIDIVLGCRKSKH